MAVNDDITIAKRSIFCIHVYNNISREILKNPLTVVTGVVSPNNQADGVKRPNDSRLTKELLTLSHLNVT